MGSFSACVTFSLVLWSQAAYNAGEYLMWWLSPVNERVVVTSKLGTGHNENLPFLKIHLFYLTLLLLLSRCTFIYLYIDISFYLKKVWVLENNSFKTLHQDIVLSKSLLKCKYVSLQMRGNILTQKLETSGILSKYSFIISCPEGPHALCGPLPWPVELEGIGIFMWYFKGCNSFWSPPTRAIQTHQYLLLFRWTTYSDGATVWGRFRVSEDL
jgi:hypothetical protein